MSDTPVDDAVELVPNRALPPFTIDLLNDGIPWQAAGAQRRSQKAWGALLTIAMSAQRRGWTEFQFYDEVMSKGMRTVGQDKQWGHWRLWTQLLTSVNGNVSRAVKSLDKAWAAGADNLRNDGLTNADDLIATAVEAAYEWTDRLASGRDGLSATQRAVMTYICASVEKRQMARVTAPARDVADACNCSVRTAWLTLKWLRDTGFLVCFSEGAGGKDPKNRRAAIYSLSDPFTLMEGGRRSGSAEG